MLECGTGMSTWFIADAMEKNYKENDVKGKLISMEHIEKWHEHAVGIFPDALSEYAEILYSPIKYIGIGPVYGSSYEEIPDHPYDIVYVDGPDTMVSNNQGETDYCANLDFVNVVMVSKKPISAVIDNRVRTVLSYGLLFGPDKVSYNRCWKLGFVEEVTKKDMSIFNSWFDFKGSFLRNTKYIESNNGYVNNIIQ